MPMGNQSSFSTSIEKKVRSLEVHLGLITRPRAKAYGFNFNKWKRMTEAASNYENPSETGRKLKEVFLSSSGRNNIHVTGGTDLTLEVSGRKWYVSDGVVDESDIAEGNLQDHIPAGNISIGPVEESANGAIVFNTKKLSFMGRTVGWIKLKFKDGKVVEFT